ncbi:MAG TPA: hypothetical protein PLB41_09480, partial [Rubrivivax sp.]|nr:hypothetical protein [Rubrivivax sp.]
MNRISLERRGMLASTLAIGGSALAGRAAAADAPTAAASAPAALTVAPTSQAGLRACEAFGRRRRANECV